MVRCNEKARGNLKRGCIMSQQPPRYYEQLPHYLLPSQHSMELALESPTTRLLLDNRRVGIGRRPTNQLVLDDVQVSSQHAEVIPTACGCLLIDLGGRNGTFVNEHRLIPDVPYMLRSGDK